MNLTDDVPDQTPDDLKTAAQGFAMRDRQESAAERISTLRADLRPGARQRLPGSLVISAPWLAETRQALGLDDLAN
jgi:hypothetical protein